RWRTSRTCVPKDARMAPRLPRRNVLPKGLSGGSKNEASEILVLLIFVKPPPFPDTILSRFRQARLPEKTLTGEVVWPRDNFPRDVASPQRLALLASLVHIEGRSGEAPHQLHGTTADDSRLRSMFRAQPRRSAQGSDPTQYLSCRLRSSRS